MLWLPASQETGFNAILSATSSLGAIIMLRSIRERMPFRINLNTVYKNEVCKKSKMFNIIHTGNDNYENEV